MNTDSIIDQTLALRTPAVRLICDETQTHVFAESCVCNRYAAADSPTLLKCVFQRGSFVLLFFLSISLSRGDFATK